MDAGYDVCVWQPAAVLAYRQKFKAITPNLQHAVLQAMLNIHAVRGRAIEVQEILVWASHVTQATAAPFAQKIKEANVWMTRLPRSTSGNGVYFMRALSSRFVPSMKVRPM